MHIYIDESGTFSNPQGKPHLAHVIAALTIPSSQRTVIIKKFNRLSRHWNRTGGEIKGRELNEDQIRGVVTLLRRFDVCLEVKVIDLALHPEPSLAKFKQVQLQNFDSRISPTASPVLLSQIAEIKAAFSAMKYPLYIQAMLLLTMVPRLVPKLCNFYARRLPKELGGFHWRVDAKAKKITDFEKAWALAIYPIMSAFSLREPFTSITGGDYSYLERLITWDDVERTAAVRAQPEFDASDYRNEEIGLGSLKSLFGTDFKFEDSKNDEGLQLVDILANAVQRALNGKLQPSGWLDIGHLVINEKPSPVAMVFLRTPSNAGPARVQGPFAQVIRLLNANAQPLWTPEDIKRFKQGVFN